MKKIAKKLLSVVLCLTLILGTFAFAVSTSASDNADGTDIPLVYVVGQGSGLVVDNEDGTRSTVYPINIPEGYIETAVEENIDVFAKAVLTQQWDEFCDVLYNKMAPLYADIKLDENGNPTNGSHCYWSWSRDALDGSKVNGKYPTERYQFYYDWRLDPYETADLLHAYIEDVLAVTGETEVALLGRCLGDCITAAYMEKYDGEYISDYISYASAVNGAEFCSKAFCGEIYLDADGVERFVYDLELATDSTMNELIQSFVTVLNKTYGLDLAMWSINNVYPNIYLNIVPRLLRDTYASFPAYWSMVGHEDYEKAKATVFHGVDTENYKTFIEKIDNYHYNVQVKIPELWSDFEDRGIQMANVTKYGFQTIPVVEDADSLGEDFCTVTAASMGATTATIDTVLPDEYIANAQANGTDKYISPDKQIDASTCVLPDTTWFIKNLDHKTFPKCVNTLFNNIINVDNYNVSMDEEYPQYLVYDFDEDTLSPMFEGNMGTTDRYNPSFWDSLKKVIEFLVGLIRDYLAGIITPAPVEPVE